jgi:hypothetical protein
MPELDPAQLGQPRVSPTHGLESFSLQLEMSREITGLAFLVCGLAFYEDEQWRQAIDVLTRAVQEDEVSEVAYCAAFYQGTAYYRCKDLVSAIEGYDRFIGHFLTRWTLFIIEVLCVFYWINGIVRKPTSQLLLLQIQLEPMLLTPGQQRDENCTDFPRH